MIRPAHVFYAISLLAAVALNSRALRQALPASTSGTQAVTASLACPSAPPRPATVPLQSILPAAWDLAPQERSTVPTSGAGAGRGKWEITRADRQWLLRNRQEAREYIWFGTILRDGTLAAVFRGATRDNEPHWFFLHTGQFLDDLKIHGLAVDKIDLRSRDGHRFELGMFAAAPAEQRGQ